MKLYVVTLPTPTSFVDVRTAAKKVDPQCVVTVAEKNKSYEFQDSIPADEVAEKFNGTVDIIEFNI